jgi:SAM-dependent methyltransferase
MLKVTAAGRARNYSRRLAWITYSHARAAYDSGRARQHGRRIGRALATDCDLFASGKPLPAGYGRGATERAVEYAWALSQRPSGVTLDAGSALNHAFVLDAFLPSVRDLHIVTLAPETVAFTRRGVSYLYADLRELPLKDDTYDTVVCISTLEHVGLDATVFGAPGGPSGDPEIEAKRALRELLRVAKPGAQLLFTVPFGERQTYGWVRQFDEPQLRDLIAFSDSVVNEITVFRYSHGWRRTSLAAAAHATYRGDRAEAVACVSLRRCASNRDEDSVS